MSAVQELLPREPEPFESGLAVAMSDTLPVEIERALDPLTTPVGVLPFLAAHESVDLWYADWPEARKRQMVKQAIDLAWLKGTRAGAIRFLGFVDATLLEAVAYPQRFVLGRARIGRSPIGHQPFVARYLVKVRTATPPRALVMGRGVLGRHRLKTPSREPFRRIMAALRVAKAPETQYRVDFGHKVPLTLSDAPLLDGTYRLGDFVSRTKL